MRKTFSTKTAYEAHKRALAWALWVALVVGAYLLWRFAMVIIVAAIAAYIFYPVFLWIKRKTRRSGMSASLTLLVSLVVILIPLTIAGIVTVAQVQVFIKDIDKAIATGTTLLKDGTALEDINGLLGDFSGGRLKVTLEQIQSYGLKAASTVGEFMLGILQSSVGGFMGFVTGAIIYIYVFTALLMHQARLITIAKQLNPLGDDIANLYLHRAGAMTKAMVRGQFIIALFQGVAGAGFLYLAGLEYFAFFALLLTVISIIPLGGGIVTIPIGIIMLLVGNIAGGLLVLITHFLVITNIDNVLRPHLVPKTARLNSALTILSVLSGVSLFGFLGIVIGPVLMILVVSTIEVYLAFQQSDAHKEMQSS